MHAMVVRRRHDPASYVTTIESRVNSPTVERSPYGLRIGASGAAVDVVVHTLSVPLQHDPALTRAGNTVAVVVVR